MPLKKQRNSSKNNRGDTLVEVLFATATAALIIVITLVVMNRNLAQIQIGVETTFVRQAIDSQAEVLRYMRDQYMEDRSAEFSDPPANTKPTLSKLWKDLVDPNRTGNNVQTQATVFGICQPADASSPETSPAAGKAFFINQASGGASTNNAEADAANIQSVSLNKSLAVSQTYARPGQGLWVESVSPGFSPSNTIRYVDFHIRACWDPPFDGPKATLGTIVRLYYETP